MITIEIRSSSNCDSYKLNSIINHLSKATCLQLLLEHSLIFKTGFFHLVPSLNSVLIKLYTSHISNLHATLRTNSPVRLFITSSRFVLSLHSLASRFANQASSRDLFRKLYLFLYLRRHIKMTPQIQKPAPDFKATAVVNGVFKDIQLSDYKGKYLVSFYFPMTFRYKLINHRRWSCYR